MIPLLSRLLHLEPVEARRAASLGALLFTLVASYTLAKTARDALFLAHLPATLLPFVFLGVGVVTTLFSIGFDRMTRDFTAWRILERAMWIAAGSLIAFTGLARLGRHELLVVFYVWVNVYGLILLSQFWVAAQALSHPREAKRTFAFVGACGIMGGLGAGLLAVPASRMLGVPALIGIAALMLAAGALHLRMSARTAEVRATEEAPSEGGPNPLRLSYVRWLAVTALCSVLVTTLVDYQFKTEIQNRFTSPEALAGFLGWFHTTTNLAALMLQLFVTRWALSRVGAAWSAAALPVGLGAGAALTVIAPGFLSAVTTRLWDQTLRHSLNRSATELFYFPLAPDVRRKVRARVEVGLQRLGDGLAGALIIVTGAILGADTRAVGWVVATLIVVWVAGWLGVRRGYARELGRNLRRMILNPQAQTVSLREAAVMGEMRRLLDSPHDRLVLHAIAMLAESAPDELDRELETLLSHGSALVRARALEYLTAQSPPAARARIEDLLLDSDAEVRIAAMRARCLLEGGPTVDRLTPYLENDDPLVRRNALACLIEVADVAEEPLVHTLVERRLREADVDERVAIVRAIGRRPVDTALQELLGPLIEDRALAVRRDAVRAAGRHGRRLLVPRMIELLGDGSTRDAAREGLAMFRDRVTGTLGDYLTDSGVSLEIRRELPRVLADIGTDQAARELLRYRERGDVRLAYRVLKAMNRIRSRDRSIRFPRDLVGEDLAWDARSYWFAFVHYRSCQIGGARSAERLLCIALNERMDQAINRIFRRLALLYRPEEILATYRGLVGGDPRARGHALEYIESALSPQHAELILPLVDESGDEHRLRLASSRHGFHFLSPRDSLAALIEGDDPWLRTCALFVAGAQRERSLGAEIDRHVVAREPYVRETALWARAALAAGS